MVTVLTRTIGPSGRDYASFTLAEADVTNIGTSADLVANDEAIVFEADAGTYSENVTINSTLTQDATRNVTYEPASGSEHGGSKSSGVIISGTSVALDCYDDYTAFDGLVFKTTGFYPFRAYPAKAITCNACIFDGTSATHGVTFFSSGGGSASERVVISNCVAHGPSTNVHYFYTRSITNDTYVRLVNCTAIGTNLGRSYRLEGHTTYALDVEIVNCITYAPRAYQATGTFTVSGSNNFGGLTVVGPFPVAIQGSPYPITPTTSFSTPLGSGDYAVYMGATGALADVTGNDVWQQGVGPASNSDVPTTDINGVTRSGTSCNPGAFEADGFVEPTVLTRTIGPTGRDYATFTLAEAAVTSIGSGTDLTFENEAIVFEADAGTYSESVDFNSSLTTDATRNVTYRPAVGSEHGGLLANGVRLAPTSGTVVTVRDDFTAFGGLVVDSAASNGIRNILANGVSIRNCIVNAAEGQGIKADYGNTGTAAAPFTVENCVVTAKWGATYFSDRFGASGPQHFAVRNCTLKPTGSADAILTSNSADTNYGEFTNNLVLGSNAYSAVGSNVITGSNNFGGSTSPFPAALQGSPYPITATTNTSPGAGDFAIYVAETGQLVDSDENDVIYQGVGPSANSDVPTTGISGGARYGTTAHPGAFATLFGSPASSPLTSSGFNSAEHLNQLEAEAPWIWLYELQTTDDPPQRYRMTNFTESVEFGMNSSGQPLTYSPTPIIHSDVEEGSDGSLPTITITVGHAGPIVASTVDAANGFVGQPIRIMLVSSLDLSASKAVIRQDGEVVAASITPRGIAFRISAFNLYQLQFPPYIFARRRCRWIFGSAECGYNTDAVGAGFSVCEKTLDACRARGDDEVSLGLPRQHPARFGGWPGIPRAGR